jgi:hypothetical protein
MNGRVHKYERCSRAFPNAPFANLSLTAFSVFPPRGALEDFIESTIIKPYRMDNNELLDELLDEGIAQKTVRPSL